MPTGQLSNQSELCNITLEKHTWMAAPEVCAYDLTHASEPRAVPFFLPEGAALF
jgi:hypothetical protein